MTFSPELRARLQAAGQDHLFGHADRLNEDELARFIDEVESVDWARLTALVEQHRRPGASDEESEPRAARAEPPAEVVRQSDGSEESEIDWEEATDLGYTMLGAGKVGAILVAGGQGTRLGFPHPKGMFPIGPVSGASLFQILAEQLLARGTESGHAIPYYVMTSDATHAETTAFFEEKDYFGLDPANVFFFRQGNMPAVDAETGRALLDRRGGLALSPDGHGGLLEALASSGALEDMARRGLEVLHYHQVDNPTTIVCDPAFIGWHLSRVSEMSTKVVAKTTPSEKMGALCQVDGATEIIEYSDLPEELADKRDAKGQPVFWAGNTAIHAINRTFLEELCAAEEGLPFHIAHKAVPYLDEQGERVRSDTPNAYKFERFIFDALPHAKRALVLEADRDREFHPVKNADGADSPETARAAMDRIAKSWLNYAGIDVAEDATIEISPLFALDEEALTQRMPSDKPLKKSVYLRP